jgi:nucleotide-binding universal stress UspA family protein
MHDILVHIDPQSPDEPCADFALGLAARFSANATVTGATVSELPTGYLLEGGRALIDELQSRARTTMRGALERFVDTARSAGVIAETVPLEGAIPDLQRSIAELARHFDVSVIGQPSRGDGRMALVEALLFDSGRPVVMVPSIHQGPVKFETVLVAWDGGKQAARAIADAMPILKQARDVQLVTVVEPKKRDAVDLPGFNITRHLARKGVNTELKRVSSDLDPGNTLLSHAADVGADMIVMGAYGHSRWREMLLGGATRQILQSMTVPAFLSHG